MNIFLGLLIVVNFLDVVEKVMQLSHEQYPREVVYTVGNDVVSLIIHIVILQWAIVLVW